ncbi:MAG: DUF5060 domain-containing protein [Phycisphaerae bacterium]|nr:DUF5060 domain-containing protein [Phycisphaerae bacterium]
MLCSVHGGIPNRLQRRSGAILMAWAILLVPGAACARTEVTLYERVEERMTNSASFDNPFTDTELRLDVSAPAGRRLGSKFTWYGFHDGDGKGGQDGNVWKFRLLFDRPGTWTVKAAFYVPGTSKRNGPAETFTYSVGDTPRPGAHGHVRIDPRNPLRFALDDGTPWVPFSIHSSLLLDREDPRVSFQWIDKHVALGVNALGVRFSSNADAIQERNHYHWLKSDGSRAESWPGHNGFDYSRFDVASYRHNEIILDHAQQKGIKLFIWFGVTGLNGQYETPGPLDQTADGAMGPLQKLHIRYVLARWAPYTCWWHWTVASEWEETRNRKGGKQIHVSHAKMLRAVNPWKMLVSNHSLGDWRLGGTKDGWGLATLQKRVADSPGDLVSAPRRFVEANDHHRIPVFNCEGIWQLANTTRNRIATVAHLMSGGFSNIAVWKKGHVDGSFGCGWEQVIDKHKTSAAALGMLAQFFNRPDIDINPCRPAHDLVTVAGGATALCLAEKGVQYVVWVDQGGTPTLDLSGQDGTFRVVRYAGANLPAEGGGTKLDAVTGGGKRSLGRCPKSGFGHDYLFVVTNAKPRRDTPPDGP